MSKDDSDYQWLIDLTEEVEPVRGARLAAAVYSPRDKVIGVGINHLKSHPFQAQWSKNEQSIFWHAETNAIHNALRAEQDLLYDCKLVVIRTNAKKGLALAAPCTGCWAAIRHYGIDSLTYSGRERLITTTVRRA